ncbi:hypothetical protein FQZ97_1212370 [compost metagenome]
MAPMFSGNIPKFSENQSVTSWLVLGTIPFTPEMTFFPLNQAGSAPFSAASIKADGTASITQSTPFSASFRCV